MSTHRILLVDGSYLISRSFYSTGDLRTSTGLRIGAVHGFLGALKQVLRYYWDHFAVVVWDMGRSRRRLDLHPEYKHGRTTSKDTPEEHENDPGFLTPYECAKLAHRLCRLYGVHSFGLRGIEGDDIIAMLMRSCRVGVIYSADKDFYQLIDGSHTCHSPLQSRIEGEDENIIDVNNFEVKSKGFKNPRCYRIGHALRGDSGDNIKGVQGIGEKTAIQVTRELDDESPTALNVRHTNYAMFRQFCRDHKSKRVQRVADGTGWAQFILSHALTDLWRDDLLTTAEIQRVRRKLSRQKTIVQQERLIDQLNEWEFTMELEYLAATMDLLAQRPKDAYLSL